MAVRPPCSPPERFRVSPKVRSAGSCSSLPVRTGGRSGKGFRAPSNFLVCTIGHGLLHTPNAQLPRTLGLTSHHRRSKAKFCNAKSSDQTQPETFLCMWADTGFEQTSSEIHTKCSVQRPRFQISVSLGVVVHQPLLYPPSLKKRIVPDNVNDSVRVDVSVPLSIGFDRSAKPDPMVEMPSITRLW